MVKKAGTAVPYRYWRIYVTLLNSSGITIGLEEIELRGTVGGADLTTGSTPVLVSSYLDNGEEGAYPGSGTVDNIVDSQFSIWFSAGGGPPHWARYDLGTAQSVAQVAIKPGPSTTYCPRDFIVQGSADGTTFTDVKAFSGVSAWSGWQAFTL